MLWRRGKCTMLAWLHLTTANQRIKLEKRVLCYRYHYCPDHRRKLSVAGSVDVLLRWCWNQNLSPCFSLIGLQRSEYQVILFMSRFANDLCSTSGLAKWVLWSFRNAAGARHVSKHIIFFPGTVKMLDLYLWLYKRSSQNKVEKEKERWQKKN